MENEVRNQIEAFEMQRGDYEMQLKQHRNEIGELKEKNYYIESEKEKIKFDLEESMN